MRAATAALCLLVASCASTPAKRPPAPRDCPPLPVLQDNPNQEQRRLHTEAMIALYVRCAKGP